MLITLGSKESYNKMVWLKINQIEQEKNNQILAPDPLVWEAGKQNRTYMNFHLSWEYTSLLLPPISLNENCFSVNSFRGQHRQGVQCFFFINLKPVTGGRPWLIGGCVLGGTGLRWAWRGEACLLTFPDLSWPHFGIAARWGIHLRFLIWKDATLLFISFFYLPQRHCLYHLGSHLHCFYLSFYLTQWQCLYLSRHASYSFFFSKVYTLLSFPQLFFLLVPPWPPALSLPISLHLWDCKGNTNIKHI